MLDFLAEEAARHANFRLVLGAAVRDVLRDERGVCGVSSDGPVFAGRVRARLVVGADGRFSRVRRAAGLVADPQSQEMELLWCRVPREAGDPEGHARLHFAPGRVVVTMAREREWQVG